MLGLTSALIPARILGEEVGDQDVAASCVLIPRETEGPFPLDLSENPYYFRQDVREDRVGIPFRVRLRVVGNANCEPMANVRVNIWHCDRDGYYSGYSNAMNQGQAGKTYLRGYQITDANGEVEFLTIFPGWYNGRVAHIHFQVRVSSSYAAISQLTFPIEEKQAIYSKHADLYPKGADPLTPSQDGIFNDGYQYQVSTLTTDDGGETYSAFLEVVVQGTGATSVGHLERENAKHFSLGQNSPNPFDESTRIPFTLVATSDITLKVFDLEGRLVYEHADRALPAGDHTLSLHLPSLGMTSATYAYQLSVHTPQGIFTDSKVMTSAR